MHTKPFSIIHKAMPHHPYTHTSVAAYTFPLYVLNNTNIIQFECSEHSERGADEAGQYLPYRQQYNSTLSPLTTNRPVLHCENHHGRCVNRFPPPPPSLVSRLSPSHTLYSFISLCLEYIHGHGYPFESGKLKMNTKQTIFNCISYFFCQMQKNHSNCTLRWQQQRSYVRECLLP